ncbi:hypothetical protein PoB_007335800 [Plakobranchus ocellatus]|uniref:Uncharacterized protein n=1 Tax=Plakobranchus ocellatus TaxID=259542 RepID=A0AAV4DRZ1_9GAST|nr:hypothetical protein PoB_007335800 [Plakobranchus ocellatus]
MLWVSYHWSRYSFTDILQILTIAFLSHRNLFKGLLSSVTSVGNKNWDCGGRGGGCSDIGIRVCVGGDSGDSSGSGDGVKVMLIWYYVGGSDDSKGNAGGDGGGGGNGSGDGSDDSGSVVVMVVAEVAITLQMVVVVMMIV